MAKFSDHKVKRAGIVFIIFLTSAIALVILCLFFLWRSSHSDSSDSSGGQIKNSSNAVEVTDFANGDINNDGESELVIGFWRYGDFGKKLEFQRTRRDPKKSYHIYIYKYSNETKQFYLVWGSSTLPTPIYDFEIVNKDGKNMLKVVEGSYDDYDKYGAIKPIKTTYWIWNEWWFEEYTGKE